MCIVGWGATGWRKGCTDDRQCVSSDDRHGLHIVTHSRTNRGTESLYCTSGHWRNPRPSRRTWDALCAVRMDRRIFGQEKGAAIIKRGRGGLNCDTLWAWCRDLNRGDFSNTLHRIDALWKVNRSGGSLPVGKAPARL